MSQCLTLQINRERLMNRIFSLGKVGALKGGGVKRLALSDEDKAGRDLLVGWMKELDLDVVIDGIGNIIGTTDGPKNLRPVMIGSHIDTVGTGGLYDGALGVLAGLEVVETLRGAGVKTRRAISIAAFTNEEGARYAPDMMGSAVHQGTLKLDKALAVEGFDGSNLGEELARIGYNGTYANGKKRAHCFLELHVEQGPVLEQQEVTLAAVTGVQGISWTEFTIHGVSNHAGTTPMNMRKDAGVVAAQILLAARKIAIRLKPGQVATVGSIDFEPGIVNVIPQKATMTVDLRNINDENLTWAENELISAAQNAADREGCLLDIKKLVRFKPVTFDKDLVRMIEAAGRDLGHQIKRLSSGAGHDAQMFAPHCPTAMIFTPSVNGLSHNIEEFTQPEHIEAGANVLLQVAMKSAEVIKA